MGRILVIEDDPGTQQLLRARLRDLGHDVTVRETGAQGIAEAKESSFDLFLVDMHLGDGVDGIEVCRRMKRDPQTRIVPVVLLSGKVRSSDDLHRGYEAGCESFMVKDDMSLVDDVIRAMLRIKSLSDELSTQMDLLHKRNETLQEALRDKAQLEDQLARTYTDSEQGGAIHRLPDGMLLVDNDGMVLHADRGARELFSTSIDGRTLGNLAPGARLEAFVRDASTVPRSGFRFNVSSRGGRPARSLVASVFPLVPSADGHRSDVRVVALHDERRGVVEADVLHLAAKGVKLEESADLFELARREYRPSRLVGNSPILADLRERALDLAVSGDSVLVFGEPGTGKRHLARVLHYASNRTGPFVAVSHQALGRSRIEAELFGDESRPSLLLQANGGTLFLEGIEKLSYDLQNRLAAVLEEGELPVPGGKPRQLNLRLVAATTEAADQSDLAPELLARFSEFFTLPPLRDRGEDVLLLARAFLDRHGAVSGGVSLSEEAWRAIQQYEWPGNLSELDAAMAYACDVAPADAAIRAQDLPAPLPDLLRSRVSRSEVLPSQRRTESVPGTHQPPSLGLELDGVEPFIEDVIAALPIDGDAENRVSFDFFEKWALRVALRRTGDDRIKAAKMLGVGKSTLYRKLNKFELH